jgi:hypothetical protein
MLTSNISISHLYHATVKSDEDRCFVDYGQMEEFQQALGILSYAGVTNDHIQLFLNKPFSKFTEYDYKIVRLLGLAIENETLTADKIHKELQEREFHSRIHGKSICFETEQLPNIGTINLYLGLTSIANK